MSIAPRKKDAITRQANDSEMLEWATEIKVRAERRAGELLDEMEKKGSELGEETAHQKTQMCRHWNIWELTVSSRRAGRSSLVCRLSSSSGQ